MTGALQDVVVADFSQMMQGGWAAQRLGDLGADVIKIESPTGEYQRTNTSAGGTVDGESIKYLAMNRNKRSIGVDLKTDDGYEVALEIVEHADVLLENFRPGVMEKLDLDYETVQEVNPEIIYVSGSGYGSDGPFEDRPGQDLLVQAESGLASITGRAQDPPTPNGTYFADELSAHLLTLHTVAALYHRERTGSGQKVEANLLNSLVDAMCQEFATHINQGVEYDRGREQHGNVVAEAPYGIYQTVDGHVAISHASLSQLSATLDVDLAEFDDATATYEHRDEIHERIERTTQTMDAETVVERLREHDMWVAEVNSLSEAVSHPQLEHNGIFREVEHPNGGTFTVPAFPVSMSETPGEVRQRPPTYGEHSREVLAELGYDEGRIDALLSSGAVRDERVEQE